MSGPTAGWWKRLVPGPGQRVGAVGGPGPGPGLAAVRRFGAAGHQVALVSRSAEHLTSLVTEPARDGTEARAHPADVPDALTERLYAFHAGRDEFRHHAEPLPG